MSHSLTLLSIANAEKWKLEDYEGSNQEGQAFANRTRPRYCLEALLV